MKMPVSSDIFVFADFRLDRAGGGLFRRDGHGAFAPVTIGSRALELLAVLIQRRGDVISKEEIMAAVWPTGWRSRRLTSSFKSRRFARSSVKSNRAKAASRRSPGAATLHRASNPLRVGHGFSSVAWPA
jgi:hypothetical protein